MNGNLKMSTESSQCSKSIRNQHLGESQVYDHKQSKCYVRNPKTQMYYQSNNSRIVSEKPITTIQTFPDQDSFRYISVPPEKNELFGERKSVVRPNRTRGKYSSVNNYLDLHFHLLREDFLGPLREGLKTLKSSNPTFATNGIFHQVKDIFLYPNTCIEIARCCREGTSYALNFDVKDLSKVDWETSKRLIYGSFICLLTDGYEIVFTGTVVDRYRVKYGQVTVKFFDEIPVSVAKDKTYLMVESRVFFNAYRHVLERMQTFSEVNFPLKLQLIDGLSTVEMPLYLQRNPNIIYDLSCVSKNKQLSVSPSNSSTWPHQEMSLDIKQAEAFHNAFSRSLALIQGPPGTGKTYVGLKICEVLVKSVVQRIQGFGPLLIVCYTNHALDQFMEGVIKFVSKGVVRVGSRCTSSLLHNYLLKHLRTQYHNRQHFSRQLQREHDDLKVKFMKLRSQFFKLTKNLKGLQEKLIEIHFLTTFMNKRHRSNFSSDIDLITWLFKLETSTLLRKLRPNLLRAFIMLINGETKKHQHPEVKELGENLQKVRQSELTATDRMTNKQEKGVSDLWCLTPSNRWRLYRLWRYRFAKWAHPHVDTLGKKYDEVSSKWRNVKMKIDLEIFRSQNVIAMTTSAAARYGDVLDQLRPKIVLVEEAAEVLESHVVCSLTKGCEHLILIGDHQQLRPNPAMFELKRKYRLDVSLFERLINNGFPYDTLQEQRRMRSEIADVVRFIYPALRDHMSVMDTSDVAGMAGNLLFVDHSELETSAPDSPSFRNEFEANYAVALVEYLMLQGYKSNQITILSPYAGQVSLMEEKITCPELIITTVDNYQGEENDIVIISLVRSNENTIGFSGDVNRICVALSRAKKGMYVLGNFGLFAEKSALWSKVITHVKARGRLGPGVKILCQEHPTDDSVSVECPDSFKKLSPDGGCQRQCETKLDCGHECPHFCHPLDRAHRQIRCVKPCPRFCPRGVHPCPGLCGDECKPCLEKVDDGLLCFEVETDVSSDEEFDDYLSIDEFETFLMDFKLTLCFETDDNDITNYEYSDDSDELENGME